MDWLEGYQYRKSVTLSRASGAVANYQMKLLLGESAGAVGEDVDCGGFCRSDFNDIRFTKADGTTLIDYWIESISGVTPNRLATIWIEFDYIGTSATTFYMYYGNASAPVYSNGVDTFIAFDDFEWGSNGDAITTGTNMSWSSDAGGTTVRISTDHAYSGTRCMGIMGQSGNPAARFSLVAKTGEYAIRARIYKPTAIANARVFVHGDGSTQSEILLNVSEDIKYYNMVPAAVDTGYNITADSWENLFEVRDYDFSANTFDIVFNGTVISNNISHTTAWINNQCVFVLLGAGEGNNLYIDDIIVRNWRSAEPAWGVWGAAVELALSDSSFNLAAYYQRLTDIGTYLRAHDGIELHDFKAELSTWGLVVEDFSGWLAAYYESMDNLGANLSTWATGYKNLAGDYDVKGQKIESFMAYLATAKDKLKNLAMLLCVADGSVLRNMAVFLSVNDGNSLKDFGMYLQALSAVPAFRSVTAHRINSVIHEVV